MYVRVRVKFGYSLDSDLGQGMCRGCHLGPVLGPLHDFNLV